MPLPAVDTGILWTFTLLWLAIVPTPGPNVLMITHVAVTRPGRDVVVAMAGNMLGLLVLATAALLGWATLLEQFPSLRFAVQGLGGAYLVYVGLRLAVGAWRTRRAVVPAGQVADDQSPEKPAFALGFVTAISNAQAVFFITSIFAFAGILDAGLATGFAAVAIMMTANAGYLGFIGWLMQRPALRTLYNRFRGPMQVLFGALFMFFGARLLARELARMAA